MTAASLPVPHAFERREQMRRTFRRNATLLLPAGVEVTVRTLDISLGGLGIVAAANPPNGLVCGIRLPLTGRRGEPVALELRVRATQGVFSAADHGFKVGLAFVAPDAAQQRLLREFLEG